MRTVLSLYKDQLSAPPPNIFMKLEKTLTKELKSYGFAHGADFIDSEQTPFDLEDLKGIHEQRRWNFAAGDVKVCLLHARTRVS
jgi:hypothetical protein